MTGAAVAMGAGFAGADLTARAGAVFFKGGTLMVRLFFVAGRPMLHCTI